MNVLKKLGWEIKDKKLVKVDFTYPKNIDIQSIITLVKHLKKHPKVLYIVLSIICTDIFSYNLKNELTLEQFKEIYSVLNLCEKKEKLLIDRWNNTEIIDKSKFRDTSKIESSNHSIYNMNIQLVKPIDPLSLISSWDKGSSVIKYTEYDTGYTHSKFVLFFQIDNNALIYFPELENFKEETHVLIMNITQTNVENKLVNIVYINIEKFPDMKLGKFSLYVSSIFRLVKNFGGVCIDYKFNYSLFKKSLQLSSAIKSSNLTGVNLTIYNIPKIHSIKLEKWRNNTEKDINELNPLINMTNTCYYDSVLFLLFYRDIPFIDKNIFIDKHSKELEEFGNSLLGMKRYIQGETDRYDSSKNFRDLMKKLPGGERFANRGQNDAAEFLQYILDIYNIKGAVMKHSVQGVTEDLKTMLVHSWTDNNESIVNFTSGFYLENFKSITTRDLVEKTITEYLEFVPKDIPEKMIQKIEKQILISAPKVYIFYTQRAYLDKIVEIPIIPDEKLIIGDKEYTLFGAVIHSGSIRSGHYNSVFLYKNIWYYFDDLESKFTKIGDFNHVLKISQFIKKAILFFYKEIKDGRPLQLLYK